MPTSPAATLARTLYLFMYTLIVRYGADDRRPPADFVRGAYSTFEDCMEAGERAIQRSQQRPFRPIESFRCVDAQTGREPNDELFVCSLPPSGRCGPR